MSNPRTQSAALSLRTPRAFSLVEMMIVLLILVIVIALVIPSLTGARNAARKAATQQLFSNLSTAASQFELSERRLPGYFSPRDMGADENETRGFSGMENLIPDLVGGVVTRPGAPQPGEIDAGPTAANTVRINVPLLGSSTQDVRGVVNKGYWVPDPKHFVTGTGQVTTETAHQTLPDVTDAWGNPVLVWTHDDAPTADTEFGARNSSTRARFYWTSNAAFVTSPALGKGLENQTTDSLLGPPATGYQHFAGLFGNPAFAPTAANPTLPPAARGKIIFHSAGIDGVYIGRRDRGGKIAGGTGGIVQFNVNINPLDHFDDVLVPMGN